MSRPLQTSQSLRSPAGQTAAGAAHTALAELSRDRALDRLQLPGAALLLLALFYLGAALLGVLILWPERPGFGLHWLGILLLYGFLNLIALWRQPANPAVRVFCILGLMVSMTILLDENRLQYPIPGLQYLRWLLNCLVYLVNFAVIIHMAALIPRRHAWTVSRPWLIYGHYAAGFLLALTAWVLILDDDLRFLPWQADALSFFHVAITATYLYGGALGLFLLGTAAWRSHSSLEFRQILVIFTALLLWMLYQITCPLLQGWIDPVVDAEVVEFIVVALVPVAFFLSIFGLRLFNLRLWVRRSLIYGLTSLLLAGVFLLLLAGAGLVAEQTPGLRPTLWQQGLLLVLLGAGFRPLARSVESAVDRFLFREKLGLRRLTRRLIPELAGIREIDLLAEALVGRLHEGLHVESASLLTADEEGQFFRAQARAGNALEDPAASQAVLTRSDLQAVGLVDLAYPVRWRGARGPAARAGRELVTALHSLDAEYLVPVHFREHLVGFFTLGVTRSGALLDDQDFEHLELLSHQVSAALENARLFELGRTDPLTRLPGRQVFEERILLELERCRRSHRPLAVLIADLDHFKKVNDTWGHLAGDQVLRAAAAVMTGHCRRVDLVARYGGEEFVFLFPEAEEQEALQLAERIRSSIEEQPIFITAGPPLRVTLSAGLCMAGPEEADRNPVELLRRADEALYRAKQEGRNRTVLHRQPPPIPSINALGR